MLIFNIIPSSCFFDKLVLKYNNHTRDNDHPKFDITFDYDFKFEKTIVTGKTKQTTNKIPTHLSVLPFMVFLLFSFKSILKHKTI